MTITLESRLPISNHTVEDKQALYAAFTEALILAHTGSTADAVAAEARMREVERILGGGLDPHLKLKQLRRAIEALAYVNDKKRKAEAKALSDADAKVTAALHDVDAAQRKLAQAQAARDAAAGVVKQIKPHQAMLASVKDDKIISRALEQVTEQ